MAISPGGRVADDSSFDRSPKSNWVERAGGLPKYLRMIAHALVRKGFSVSRAIATAKNRLVKLAATSKNPKVKAAAAAAIAEWEAKRAKSHVASGEIDDIDWTDVDPDIDIDAMLAGALVAALDNGDIMTTTDDIKTWPELLDGIYEEVVDDAPDLANALLAGAAPLHPPKTWFDNPSLPKPTPITLTADGQVYGHVALWNVDHIGLPGQFRKPPRSRSGYSFFKTGVIETQEGEMVPVGNITYAGGHASLNATAGQATKHYDDTASAFADVNVGEDAFGIWVAGGARPGVSEDSIRAIRASAPSGDWRPINGQLEMVAICQVNVPGYPVTRAMVAGGEIQSLVAAGAAPLYALRMEEGVVASIQELEDRFTRLTDEVREKLGDPVAPSEDDVHRTVVAAADVSPLESMRGRLDEAKRRQLDGRMAAVRR